MKAQIENLKALIRGKELTNYQRALALNEWAKLITHIEELEQLATPAVSNRRELLVAFILWYWFKCKDKETREASDIIDEFLATNSL